MKPLISILLSVTVVHYFTFTTGLLSPVKSTANNVVMQTENATDNKNKVVALLKSIETGAKEPVAFINPKKYIQHNLNAADGLSGFNALMQQLPPNSAKVNIVRVFQDGDFVFAHTEYDFFGPKIGFDIFRFENGRITEHWDNLAQKAATPNRSGHTQIDGPVEVKDLAKTESNKSLVKYFYEDILMKGRKEKIVDYFNGNNYIQHGSGGGDGIEIFNRICDMIASGNSQIKFSKIHKVLGEGNFVLVVAEGEFNGKPVAFYDLFRVENAKIAEHWDTIEEIPGKQEWKNSNGKFGF